MTLQTFCDLVWLEIWDDCPPMGDQSQYRDIVTKLFIECKNAWEITYQGYDDKGKKVTKRLATVPVAGSTGNAMADARALYERIKGKTKPIDAAGMVAQVQAAKDAAGLASPPSG